MFLPTDIQSHLHDISLLAATTHNRSNVILYDGRGYLLAHLIRYIFVYVPDLKTNYQTHENILQEEKWQGFWYKNDFLTNIWQEITEQFTQRHKIRTRKCIFFTILIMDQNTVWHMKHDSTESVSIFSSFFCFFCLPFYCLGSVVLT